MVDVASHKVENAEKALIKVMVIGDVTFDHDPKTWTVHDQKQMMMNDENVMYQILSDIVWKKIRLLSVLLFVWRQLGFIPVFIESH